MTDARTQNFNLIKPEFDKPRYHQDMNDNFTVIDALLAKYIAAYNVVGVWANTTTYSANQAVVDPDNGQLYTCVSGHTSPASPTTFSAYRAANPSVWASLTLGVRSRGVWTPSTAYVLGDFVTYGDIYAVCTTAHTSNASSTGFSNDSANWSYLIDFDGSDITQNITLSGGSTAISWVNGNHAILTVSANSTITFTVPTKTSRTQRLLVTVIFGGAYTLTIPTARWPNGAAPTISQAVGGSRQEFLFSTSDNGSTYDGNILGMNIQ